MNKPAIIPNLAQQIADQGEQDAISSVMNGILPKIAPMMKQASKDFSEFLAGVDDGEEKTIIIKKFKDKPPSVMVMGNSKSFHIQCSPTEKIFRAEKDAVLYMFTAVEFVEMLLSGKIKK